MSHQKLPTVTCFKNTLEKQQIAHRMYYHRKKIMEVESKKSKLGTTQDSLDQYKYLLQQNPKRNYFIESKFTEIERQNRLLFQKISKISKQKKRNPQKSMERMRSLNITFRKKQIQQIEYQNAKLFGRILHQKPSISFKQSDKQFMRTRQINDRLSKKEKYRLQEWY